MKRDKGLLIISISALIYSLQVSMAMLTMYLDKMTGTPIVDKSVNDYIPSITYGILVVSIGIGIFFIFNKKN